MSPRNGLVDMYRSILCYAERSGVEKLRSVPNPQLVRGGIAALLRAQRRVANKREHLRRPAAWRRFQVMKNVPGQSIGQNQSLRSIALSVGVEGWTQDRRSEVNVRGRTSNMNSPVMPRLVSVRPFTTHFLKPVSCAIERFYHTQASTSTIGLHRSGFVSFSACRRTCPTSLTSR